MTPNNLTEKSQSAYDDADRQHDEAHASKTKTTWWRPIHQRGRPPTAFRSGDKQAGLQIEPVDDASVSTCGHGRVLWPQQPIQGESLLSWTVRTAHENVLPSCYTLLRRSGQRYKEMPISALVQRDRVDALSIILGCDPSEIHDRMLHPCATDGFLELNGVSVRVISLATNVRRFSPTTLGALGAHLSMWMLRTLPFCTRSWEYLQDQCSECGFVQSWRKAGDQRLCDQCSNDLTSQPAEKVERCLRPSLSQVAALFAGSETEVNASRDVLPEGIRLLAPAELFELTISIAGLVDADLPGWLAARLDIDESRRLAIGTAKSWDLLKGYPHSVIDALWDAKITGDATYAAKFTRRLAAMLRGDDRTNSLPGVRTALKELHDLVSSDEFGARNVLVKVAARKLGTTESKIAAARDGGILRRRTGMSNGRMLFNLDSNEVEALAKSRLGRIGTTLIGLSLRIPPYAVAQLIAHEVLDVEKHPWLISVYGGAQVTKAGFSGFLERLSKVSRENGVIAQRVTLNDAMRGYGGGVKPWATVFQKLLDGDVPFEILETESNGQTILISAADARRLWALPPAPTLKTYSQLDALCILNFALKKGHIVAPLRCGMDGEKWIVSGHKLARAASRYISNAEVATRMGVRPEQSSAVRATLRGRGVSMPIQFGWNRNEVFDKAHDLCRHGPFLKIQ